MVTVHSQATISVLGVVPFLILTISKSPSLSIGRVPRRWQHFISFISFQLISNVQSFQLHWGFVFHAFLSRFVYIPDVCVCVVCIFFNSVIKHGITCWDSLFLLSFFQFHVSGKFSLACRSMTVSIEYERIEDKMQKINFTSLVSPTINNKIQF